MTYKPLVMAGAIVAMLGGLAAIGFTMPWNAAAREDLLAVESKAEKCCRTCENGISEINGKLDILIRRDSHVRRTH
jgi:hypothetical protein